MHNLEFAKLKLERNKVSCAKEEMEVRILEREAEIHRLKESIKIQHDKLVELDEKIKASEV